MEHRCTERLSSKLKVLIYRHDFPIVMGIVVNGSRHGVFVETKCLGLSCERQIELGVLLEVEACKWCEHRVKALVIHLAANGFGAAIDFEGAKLSNQFLLALTMTNLGKEPEINWDQKLAANF